MTVTWRPLSYANFPIIPCHWALSSDWPVLCVVPLQGRSKGGACAPNIIHPKPIYLPSWGNVFIPYHNLFGFVCLFLCSEQLLVSHISRFCCTLHYQVVLNDVYDIFVKSAMTSCREHFILKQFRWGRSSSGKEEEKQHILWKLVLFCVMDEPTVGTQDVVKTDKGWSFRICSTI